jgi:hypothetical protein
MAILDDFVRSIKNRVDTALEQWFKMVPVVIASVGTDGSCMVTIQGSTTTYPAVFMDGQVGSVGDQGYGLWHPGRTRMVVFQVRAAGAYSGEWDPPVSTSTTTAWARLTGGSLSGLMPGVYAVTCSIDFATGTSGTGRKGVGFTHDPNNPPSGSDLIIVSGQTTASQTLAFTGITTVASTTDAIHIWRYLDVPTIASAVTGSLQAHRIG